MLGAPSGRVWLAYLVTGSCVVGLVAVLVQAAAMQEQLGSFHQQLAAAEKLSDTCRQSLQIHTGNFRLFVIINLKYCKV
jgi:hypothetical protein